MNIRPEVKKATCISSICIFLYLSRYVIANLLSVLTPALTEAGIFTKDFIGVLSSVYCITYAAGQLINGILGDKLRPKYMVSMGLVISGLTTLLFPFVSIGALRVVLYGATGFGLSMLRGPLVKVISENSEKKHARLACAFLSFASFFGPFIAGILVIYLGWTWIYTVVGAVVLLMAVAAFVIFSVFEKIGYIVPVKKPETAEGKKRLSLSDIFGVFRADKFIIYFFIGMIFEIVSSSIAFWRPTYLTEYLAFSVEDAALINSLISFCCTFNPFLALIVCRLFRYRDLHAIRYPLAGATLLYVAMFFISPEVKIVHVALFILSLILSGIASGIMWSYYIPSLASSGKVSGANGILDCSGYVAASLMNLAFSGIVDRIGWSGTILVWGGIMFIGVILTCLHKEKPAEE